MDRSTVAGAEHLEASGETWRRVAKVHRADVEQARERNRQSRLRWVLVIGVLVLAYLIRRAVENNPLALGWPQFGPDTMLYLLPVAIVLMVGVAISAPLIMNRSPHVRFSPEEIPIDFSDVRGVDTVLEEVTRSLQIFLTYKSFREELGELAAKNANLSVTVAMSNPGDDAWSGIRGHIDSALLASTVQDLISRRAHICGPPAMMSAVKAALLELGVHETLVKTEAFGTVTRNPATKRTQSTGIAGKVVFQASETTAPVPLDATILDVADEFGVSIDNACRSGTCASCRVRLVSGNVSMEVEDALTPQERAEGYILACQAKVRGDVTVDA